MGAILKSAPQSRTMSSKAVLSLCLSLCFITTITTAATASECLTTAGNVVGSACVFPFTYGGTTYYSCTTAGGFAPWCYTEVNSAGVGVTGKFGDCGTSSACTGETTTTSTTTTSTSTTSTTTAVDVCVASCVDTCAATTTSTTSTTSTTTTTKITTTWPTRIFV